MSLSLSSLGFSSDSRWNVPRHLTLQVPRGELIIPVLSAANMWPKQKKKSCRKLARFGKALVQSSCASREAVKMQRLDLARLAPPLQPVVSRYCLVFRALAALFSTPSRPAIVPRQPSSMWHVLHINIERLKTKDETIGQPRGVLPPNVAPSSSPARIFSLTRSPWKSLKLGDFSSPASIRAGS